MPDLKYTPAGASFRNAQAVVKNDGTVYTPPLQAFWVGTSGDFVIESPNGNVVTYKNAVGWFYVEARRVMSATTAADIVGHR